MKFKLIILTSLLYILFLPLATNAAPTFESCNETFNGVKSICYGYTCTSPYNCFGVTLDSGEVQCQCSVTQAISTVFATPPKTPVDTRVKFTPQVPLPQVGTENNFFSKTYIFPKDGTIAPIGQLIKEIIKYMIGIAGILGTIMLMYGGFLYIISGGQGKLITDAQNHIVSAIVGIVLAATSYIILATVNTDLVNFKATTISSIQAMGCCKSDSTCGVKSQNECSNASDFIKGGTCDQQGQCVLKPDTSGICYIQTAGCGTQQSPQACTSIANSVWLGNDMQAIINMCGLDSTDCSLGTTKPLTACKLSSGSMGFCINNTCSGQGGSLGEICGGIQYSGTCQTASKTLAVARSFNPFGYFFNSAVGSPCPIGHDWVGGGRSCSGLNLGCCK